MLADAAAARAETASPALPPPPAGDRALTVGGADARGASTFRARLAFDFASHPVTVLAPDQTESALVSEQFWLSLGASFALAHRVLFALELPVLLAQSGQGPAAAGAPPATGAGLGDARLLVRARVLGAADASEKLAAGVELRVPSASRDWAGDPGFGVRPFVGASTEGRRARLGGELGVLFARSAVIDGLLPLRTGTSLTLGLAASVALDRKGELGVGPELAGRFAFGGDAKLFDPRSSSGQALLGARYVPGAGPVVIALGAGPGLGEGVGAADLRVLASVAYSPEEPAPPPDRDGDRVADAHDSCPSVAGAASEDPLMNGCPELPTDTDGDAIADMLDACPKQAGPAHRERRLHGCPPAPDSDGDGFDDPIDACPAEAGVASQDRDRNGCPPPAAKLVAAQIVISEQVKFETGTAELRPESAGILEAVRRVLGEHPELERVEIQGHTDSTGSVESNRKLSDERARAVLAWLVEHGITEARLVAKGYGPDRPLAGNDSEAGRATNRRVEFHVIASKPGVAP
ncbi:MAG TPA: OmpA family protein [Polyangiaceae bacterium]